MSASKTSLPSSVKRSVNLQPSRRRFMAPLGLTVLAFLGPAAWTIACSSDEAGTSPVALSTAGEANAPQLPTTSDVGVPAAPAPTAAPIPVDVTPAPPAPSAAEPAPVQPMPTDVPQVPEPGADDGSMEPEPGMGDPEMGAGGSGEEMPEPDPEPAPEIPGLPAGVPPPLLADWGEPRFYSDFSEDGGFPDGWVAPQETRWEQVGGFLHGQPSPDEYQEANDDHQGLEPLFSYNFNRADVAFALRFRINSGRAAGVTYMQLGHFAIRMRYGNSVRTTVYPEGSWRNSERRDDAVDVITTDDWVVEQGTWYHLLMESVGEELRVQVAPEGTDEVILMQASHEFISQVKDRILFGGYRDGTIDIDEMAVWTL